MVRSLVQIQATLMPLRHGGSGAESVRLFGCRQIRRVRSDNETSRSRFVPSRWIGATRSAVRRTHGGNSHCQELWPSDVAGARPDNGTGWPAGRASAQAWDHAAERIGCRCPLLNPRQPGAAESPPVGGYGIEIRWVRSWRCASGASDRRRKDRVSSRDRSRRWRLRADELMG
jgi:hypothetical protein